ncbi:MAG: phosphate/phosphite/phosphonate ABC transporter substrate-binding protein [Armatimonadota bacterium]|nr:phosphate/phosphite/phosphonate ABC transporter substrate-binding protein [Armatimonadota bacterium]
MFHYRIRGMRLIPVTIGVLALLTLLPSGANPSPKSRLVVAIQPTFAVTEMLDRAKPLERFLEQRLGNRVDVEIYIPLSQAGVIEALRFGQAHVAFMGPWAALLAVERAGAELVLAEVREVLIDGQKTQATYYFSYWIVLRDSPYQSLEELRGKRACFPSPVSTSGFVAPMARLVELKLLSRSEREEVDPRRFFGDVLFAGGYGQCWQALKAGQVDVTVIAGDVPESLYKEVLANIRILEKQGPLPSHAVLFSKELKEPLRTQLLNAILALGAPAYRDLMRTFISGIFVRFQKSDATTHLGPLKRFLELTGLRFTERL